MPLKLKVKHHRDLGGRIRIKTKKKIPIMSTNKTFSRRCRENNRCLSPFLFFPTLPEPGIINHKPNSPSTTIFPAKLISVVNNLSSPLVVNTAAPKTPKLDLLEKREERKRFSDKTENNHK